MSNNREDKKVICSKGVCFDLKNHSMYSYPNTDIGTQLEMLLRDVENTEHEPIVNAFWDIVNEALVIFIRKQLDYGPGNIAKFGFAGVLVRMSDKMERLMHLATLGQEPRNESIEDTLIDIANYALIGLMCLRGKWPGAKNYKLVGGDDSDRSNSYSPGGTC